MRLRLLLADDHKMVRDGLKSLIDGEATLSVVGEASNGHETVERVAETAPHIVIMDLAMPPRRTASSGPST